MYPQEVIDDVRMGNDIVDVIGEYVKLNRRGSNYMGLCPFHKEKTPSFSVNADNQFYHCFGCGVSGNVYSFMMDYENYSFPDAVKYLAGRINYTLPEYDYSEEQAKKREVKKSLYSIHKIAARFFYDCLQQEQGKAAAEYLDKRQILPNMRRKFGFGFAPRSKGLLYKKLKDEGFSDELILASGLVNRKENGEFYDKFFNRLMLPIIDVYGNIVGFGGRVLDDGKPKYLNSPETEIFSKSRNLYNLNFAKAARNKNKEFILVEGYMDAIAIFQAGYRNVVASLGTAFNENHARTLKSYAKSVILLFDSDEAGEKAVIRAIPVLENAGLKVKVLQVHDAKDPDEFIKKFGSEEFGKLLASAESQILFRVKYIRKNYNFDLLEERISFTNEVSKILSEVKNPIEADAYTKEIADITGIDLSAIRTQISRISAGMEVPKINPNIKNNASNKLTEKGKDRCDSARRSIINIAAMHRDIYEALKPVLKAEEFVDPFYIKSYNILSALHDEGKAVVQNAFVDFFEDKEERQRASDIFIINMEFPDRDKMEKAVNDQIRLVKTAYYDNLVKIEEAKPKDDETENRIRDFLNEKKKCAKLSIKI